MADILLTRELSFGLDLKASLEVKTCENCIDSLVPSEDGIGDVNIEVILNVKTRDDRFDFIVQREAGIGDDNAKDVNLLMLVCAIA